MRPRLQATNLLVQDLADQPASEYVLFVQELLGTKAALAVDRVVDRNGAYQVYLGADLIAVLEYGVKWVLVRRDRIEAPTVEEWERKRASDNVVIDALEKELYPKKEGEPERGGMPLMVFDPDGTGGKDAGLGQYL